MEIHKKLSWLSHLLVGEGLPCYQQMAVLGVVAIAETATTVDRLYVRLRQRSH